MEEKEEDRNLCAGINICLLWFSFITSETDLKLRRFGMVAKETNIYQIASGVYSLQKYMLNTCIIVYIEHYVSINLVDRIKI